MFLSGFAVSLIFTGLLDCLSVKQDFLLKSPKLFYILPVMFFLCWLPYLMTYMNIPVRRSRYSGKVETACPE